MNKTKKIQIIDGKYHAENLLQKVQERVKVFKEKFQISPTLVTILVGEDPASELYVNMKARKSQELGINTIVYRLPSNIAQHELHEAIKHFNEVEKDVHGILLQLPLPEHLNEHHATNMVAHEKDVDGFTSKNLGLLLAGKPNFIPCTPQGIVMLLNHVFTSNLDGKKVAIIGRSIIVGKPMAALLLNKNCTVTILHSKSIDPQLETQKADIVIAAAGVPKLVKEDWIKEGACLIDVGINKINDKIVGDIDFESVKEKAAYITPVPGGVGPMTIACLMNNTLHAAYEQRGIVYDNIAI